MKKYFVYFTAFALVSVTVLNFNLSFSESNNLTLSNLEAAACEGGEVSTGDAGQDMTWNDVYGMLNDFDRALIPPHLLNGHQAFNASVCNTLHAYCDNYDLSGDPAYGWVVTSNGTSQYQQIDDCDGQPNFC